MPMDLVNARRILTTSPHCSRCDSCEDAILFLVTLTTALAATAAHEPAVARALETASEQAARYVDEHS